jgi:hypothetical protein
MCVCVCVCVCVYTQGEKAGRIQITKVPLRRLRRARVRESSGLIENI